MAKRRRNGEGCFQKSTCGRYIEYRVTYYDELGKRKLKTFSRKTKEECLQAYKEWKAEQEGKCPDEISENITVAQWANTWFENYVVNHVKETTVNDDRSILDRHIIPDLRHLLLKKLTPHLLTKFYNACLKKSNGKGGTLDPKTVKNIRAVMNRMLKCACRIGILKDNPNALAIYPKCTKKETEILNSEDYDKLIKHCIDQATQWDMLIIFLLCVGARLGEALGLQWSKVSFEKQTIRINQQMQSVPNKDKNSKYKYTKKIIDSTKTKSSNRTLPMSSDIEHILRYVRKLQAVNKMAQGAKYHRDLDLVFAREDGYFVCDTTFRAFVNKRLAEAGIEHHKIHSFRHSCATSFFEQKADIKKVSKWLGHSCIGITLDTYTHVQPQHLEELAELQNNRFKKIFNSNEKDIPDEMLPNKDDWGA